MRRGDDEYRFGDLQAAIFSGHYERALVGDPWRRGKVLLREVGSGSYLISNVFKGNPVWKDLLVSGGIGAYRLAVERDQGFGDLSTKHPLRTDLSHERGDVPETPWPFIKSGV